MNDKTILGILSPLIGIAMLICSFPFSLMVFFLKMGIINVQTLPFYANKDFIMMFSFCILLTSFVGIIFGFSGLGVKKTGTKILSLIGILLNTIIVLIMMSLLVFSVLVWVN